VKRRTRHARWVKLAGCAALIALTAALRLAAQNGDSLPAAWAHWKYFRAIELPATGTTRITALGVPIDAFAHGQSDLADLRVTDNRGQEVPYVLFVEYGFARTETLAARQLELSYVPEKYTQAVLDVGAQAPFHNSIHVLTPFTNFIAWVQLEISEDARAWRRTGSLQPIYCFFNKGVAGAETLTYPETNGRYIRLRIYDNVEKFPLNAVYVTYTVQAPENHMSFNVAPGGSQEGQKTVWRADLGYALPFDSVRIESSTEEFYRRAEVYSSNDQQDWTFAGAGEIYRFHADPPPDAAPPASGNGEAHEIHARDSIPFSERSARYWRVEVENGNDAPLSGVSMQLRMATREVVFRQEPERRYALVYGQSELKTPPQYDLAQVLSAAQIRGAQPVSGVGPEKTNASWSDPRPWSERNSVVLWIAVILAALVLAFVAFQSLKSAAPSGSGRDSSLHPPSS
jgi:Protein of unknown function (DUF3999)